MEEYKDKVEDLNYGDLLDNEMVERTIKYNAEKQGMYNTKSTIIKNMLASNMNIEAISKVTDIIEKKEKIFL